jgi:hypothetical protein
MMRRHTRTHNTHMLFPFPPGRRRHPRPRCTNRCDHHLSLSCSCPVRLPRRPVPSFRRLLYVNQRAPRRIPLFAQHHHTHARHTPHHTTYTADKTCGCTATRGWLARPSHRFGRPLPIPTVAPTLIAVATAMSPTLKTFKRRCIPDVSCLVSRRHHHRHKTNSTISLSHTGSQAHSFFFFFANPAPRIPRPRTHKSFSSHARQGARPHPG